MGKWLVVDFMYSETYASNNTKVQDGAVPDLATSKKYNNIQI